jgi:hypothetical protein
MLLQDLPARLLATRLALGVGTEGLRAAREAAPGLPELSAGLAAAERAANATANAAADGAAQQAAKATAESLWLELLLSGPELFERRHIRLLVDECAAADQQGQPGGRKDCTGAIGDRTSASGTGAWTGGIR